MEECYNIGCDLNMPSSITKNLSLAQAFFQTVIIPCVQFLVFGYLYNHDNQWILTMYVATSKMFH